MAPLSMGVLKKRFMREPETIEEKVTLAQQGDYLTRNDLIKEYQPFIKKVISKVCHRYVNEEMDEYSVGLTAFNEAIDQYSEKEGSRFLTFANMVIRRRVIDHIRREQRQTRNLVFHYEEETDENIQEETFAEQKASIDQYTREEESAERVTEIMEYQKLLAQYDITFKALVKHCPKHIDARDNAKEIAYLIAHDEELSRYLKDKKRLPIKNIEKMVDCSRKTIERNRKYIIAVALIYLGDFHSLQSYIET